VRRIHGGPPGQKEITQLKLPIWALAARLSWALEADINGC
jgi:hypothetical protein